MTIPRLKEIFKFQKANPPQHILLNAIAKYCGILPKEDISTFNGNSSELDENGNSLFDMFPQG